MEAATALRAFAVLVALVASVVWAEDERPADPAAPRRRSKAVEIIEKVRPTIVVVEATNQNGERVKSGTGIVLDAKGVVVANARDLGGLKELTVRLRDGQTCAATVGFIDKKADVALLVIKHSRPLHAAKIANSDHGEQLRLGDSVLAVHVRSDASLSCSVGILSGGRDLANVGEKLLQIDSNIGPGLSPGVIIGMDGTFLGILIGNEEARRSIGFAIPSNTIKKLMADLPAPK